MRKVSPYDKFASTTKKPSPEYQCVECLMSTKYICVLCSSNPYCNRCFHKVHSAGVVFRTHELLIKDNPYNAIGQVLGCCKDHDKKLDYFCQTCSLPICYNCTSTTHGKHDMSKLLNNVCD